MKKNYKSENEFRYSPPWSACPDFTSGGRGRFVLKDIHFLICNFLFLKPNTEQTEQNYKPLK